MRSLIDVLTRIVEKVPQEENDLRFELDRLTKKLAYTAPELESALWLRLHHILRRSVDEERTDDWIRDIRDIYVGKK